MTDVAPLVRGQAVVALLPPGFGEVWRSVCTGIGGSVVVE